MEKSPYLKKLKEITPKLPNLSDIVKKQYDNKVVYDVNGDGEAIGVGLLKIDDVAVQKAFLVKGTVFKKHIHKDAVEILIIYSGSGTFVDYSTGEKKDITVGDCVRVEKGIPHGWEFKEDCKMIGVVIPSIEGFPDV